MKVNNTNENNSNSSDNSKITKNKPTKAQIYKQDRDKIILELEKIIGLNEINRGVLLYDLEHNEQLKKYLIQIIPDIKKYYKYGNWNYFVNQHTKEGDELSEISLLRAIFKDENYELISKRKTAVLNNKKTNATKIYFLKNVNIKQYLV